MGLDVGNDHIPKCCSRLHPCPRNTCVSKTKNATKHRNNTPTRREKRASRFIGVIVYIMRRMQNVVPPDNVLYKRRIMEDCVYAIRDYGGLTKGNPTLSRINE
jgi:hypothetical protein